MMAQNNDKLCLCGSGRFYKDCCQKKLNPTDEIIRIKLIYDFESSRKKYLKICLHPLQNECKQDKIHAHTISKKAVLKLIAKDGKVLMPVMYAMGNEFKMQHLGIEADATKLYCFCSQHDKMFNPIDKNDVTIDCTTAFLYAYRAFAGVYYRIEREIYIYENRLSPKYNLTKVPEVILLHEWETLLLKKLNYCRSLFDNAIISQNYDILETHTIYLSYRVLFAVSSCFSISFDIYGNRVKKDSDEIHVIYISVIPDKATSKIIISWMREDSDIYRPFEKQLKSVPQSFVLKYLNNLLPMNCENMTISPLLWESWSASTRQEFLDTADCRKNELAKKESYSHFSEKSYNLFENLEIKNIKS